MFGIKHLTGSFVSLIVVGLALWLLVKHTAKKDYSVKLIVVRTLAILLLGLEVFKHIYSISYTKGFELNHIPLHICHMFLWATPIMAFSGFKCPKVFTDISVQLGAIAGLSVLIMPTAVLGDPSSWLPIADNVLVVNSLLYHSVMLTSSLYIIITRLYRPSLKGSIRIFFAVLALGTFDIIINTIFNTDYMSLGNNDKNWLYGVILKIGYAPYVVFVFTCVFLANLLFCLPWELKDAKKAKWVIE